LKTGVLHLLTNQYLNTDLY